MKKPRRKHVVHPIQHGEVRYLRFVDETMKSDNDGVYLILERVETPFNTPGWKYLVLHPDISDMYEATGDVRVLSDEWLTKYTRSWEP